MVHNDEPMMIRTNIRNQRQRPLSRWRSASATVFATALAMCLVPMGCAATDEYAETPPQSLERTLHPSIVNALQICANEGVSRLHRHAYEISFEVETTAKGIMTGIASRGKRLDDEQMETCMIQALRAMPVHDLFPLEDTGPATSQNNSPAARALFGTTSVLPQLIRFAPIVIAAPGGITIVVAVVVVVAVAAVATTTSKPTKEECAKEMLVAEAECKELFKMQNPPIDVVGRSLTMGECIFNHLSEDCGGKKLDWGKQGRPGRRY